MAGRVRLPGLRARWRLAAGRRALGVRRLRRAHIADGGHDLRSHAHEEPGLTGGRAKGKKSLVGVAVERIEPRGFGRCRMALLSDASTDSLRAFLIDHVQLSRLL